VGAYERLLLDAIAGRLNLFVRSDEQEQAWRWVMPILEAWANDPAGPQAVRPPAAGARHWPPAHWWHATAAPGPRAVITQSRLTLRGVGVRPVLHAAGQNAEGKALIVVRGGDIRIENLEMRGARVASGNGAGIRLEGGRLQVERCAFFDNEMGLLTANRADIELTVHDCEFGEAPRHIGLLHHLLYVGRIGRFEIRGSRLQGGFRGHLIKSRARLNHIHANFAVDDETGEASYASAVRHSVLYLSATAARAALARVTLAKMSLALAVQMNGLGSML
jgi:hypothetical protein